MPRRRPSKQMNTDSPEQAELDMPLVSPANEHPPSLRLYWRAYSGVDNPMAAYQDVRINDKPLNLHLSDLVDAFVGETNKLLATGPQAIKAKKLKIRYIGLGVKAFREATDQERTDHYLVAALQITINYVLTLNSIGDVISNWQPAEPPSVIFASRELAGCIDLPRQAQIFRFQGATKFYGSPKRNTAGITSAELSNAFRTSPTVVENAVDRARTTIREILRLRGLRASDLALLFE